MSLVDWTWTDDPADPCSLCIQWEYDEETDVLAEFARPYLPDGSTVPRVYRNLHGECMAAAAAYAEETA